MKKEAIYLIGGLLLGGGAGASITYILTKKHYEKVVNDELKKLKELNRKEVKNAKIEAVNDILVDHDIVKKPTEEERIEEERALSEFKNEAPVDYTSYANGDDACDEDVADNYPSEEPEKVPYVIEEDAIEPSYDIVSLTYFDKDKTLSDDVSTSIVLPEDTISAKLLDEFLKSGEDQIYICKDSQSTVYEITRYSGSYHEEVLGLPEDYGGEDGSYIDT